MSSGYGRKKMVAGLVLIVVGWGSSVRGLEEAWPELVNPNQASLEELQSLPGFDATLAKKVVDGRPFLSMGELLQAAGISQDEESLDPLGRRMFIPINLNTASKEEILAIPGVGARMAHEFDEYRPYRAISQFRREIGKYVDDKEVARLERYVFLPIDLNTASDEEILAIPGMGKRMLHEFKEYRPHKSIEQFRREIGKYVDDKEVARLERYVTLE